MRLRLCNGIVVRMKKMNRNYHELIRLSSFDERFEYLRLRGHVGEETFGFDRYLNQAFYNSAEWKRIRNQVIARDLGCDLGIEGRELYSNIIVHHMNPISKADIIESSDLLMDPDFLITVSLDTHNAIHYGDETLMKRDLLVTRKKNDTCPWRVT